MVAFIVGSFFTNSLLLRDVALIDNNDFAGTIPTELASLDRLKVLDLSKLAHYKRNKTGACNIIRCMCYTISVRLAHELFYEICTGDNSIIGTIPEKFEELTRLEQLYLSK